MSASFADALAALRTHLWQQRLSALLGQNRKMDKILAGLIENLARAG